MTPNGGGHLVPEHELEEWKGANRALVKERDGLLENIRRLYKVLGARQGTCRSCAAPIWWVKTAAGKPAPFNAQGASHFADCPQANQHRRRR